MKRLELFVTAIDKFVDEENNVSEGLVRELFSKIEKDLVRQRIVIMSQELMVAIIKQLDLYLCRWVYYQNTWFSIIY